MNRVIFAIPQIGAEDWHHFWLNPDNPRRSNALVELDDGKEYWLKHIDGGWEKVPPGIYSKRAIDENIKDKYQRAVEIP